MKNQRQRINNIIGQLEGVAKMIEQERDCFEIATQMKAANSALEISMAKFIEENFIDCLGSCKEKKGKERLKKLISTLIKNS